MKHGGKRRGSGRKPIGKNSVNRSINLSEERWALARRIGEGNASKGIRIALSAHETSMGLERIENKRALISDENRADDITKTVKFLPEQLSRAVVIGRGNATLGIRLALDCFPRL